MKLVLLDEAQRQFENEDAWWRENRDSQELFIEEFSKTLEQTSRRRRPASATAELAGN
jgi:hypothetical protein